MNNIYDRDEVRRILKNFIVFDEPVDELDKRVLKNNFEGLVEKLDNDDANRVSELEKELDEAEDEVRTLTEESETTEDNIKHAKKQLEDFRKQFADHTPQYRDLTNIIIELF